MQLCRYEIEVLQEICLLRPAEPSWGAALGAAYGILRGLGYLTPAGPTPKGWAYAIYHLESKP